MHLRTNDWPAQADSLSEKALAQRFSQFEQLIRGTVRRVAVHLLEDEDLYQELSLRLVAALRKFDPERGVDFTTFAIAQIRGGILEYMRASGTVSRYERADYERYQVMCRAYIEAHGVEPSSPSDLAEFLGVEKKLCQNLAQAKQHRQLASINYRYDPNSELTLTDSLVATTNVEEVIFNNADRDALFTLVDFLPEREKIVVRAYYLDELTFREIGEVLGISADRALQLHKRAIERLRVLMLQNRPEMAQASEGVEETRNKRTRSPLIRDGRLPFTSVNQGIEWYIEYCAATNNSVQMATARYWVTKLVSLRLSKSKEDEVCDFFDWIKSSGKCPEGNPEEWKMAVGMSAKVP